MALVKGRSFPQPRLQIDPFPKLAIAHSLIMSPLLSSFSCYFDRTHFPVAAPQ